MYPVPDVVHIPLLQQPTSLEGPESFQLPQVVVQFEAVDFVAGAIIAEP